MGRPRKDSDEEALGAPDATEQPWFRKAAELIVREEKKPWLAFTEVGAALTSVEAEVIYRSKTFQGILWAEREKFRKELANTPYRSKESAVGLMMYLIQKLIDAGEFDKAAQALEKLMKAEGWTGPDSQVNVYQGLSQKDYAELKKELNDRLKGSSGAAKESRVN